MAMKSLKDLLRNININPDTNPDRVVFLISRHLSFQRSKEEMIGKGQDELADKQKGRGTAKVPEKKRGREKRWKRIGHSGHQKAERDYVWQIRRGALHEFSPTAHYLHEQTLYLLHFKSSHSNHQKSAEYRKINNTTRLNFIQVFSSV